MHENDGLCFTQNHCAKLVNSCGYEKFVGGSVGGTGVGCACGRRGMRCSAEGCGRESPFLSCSSALHGGLTQLKGEYRSSTSKIKNMAHQEEVNHELCVLIRD